MNVNNSPKNSLRILITNNTLDLFAGSEKYTLELAIALKELGHKPVAFSYQLGKIARYFNEHGVPVIDNLDSLGEPPDIIHGHHHLETMTALLHFPNTPAVYYCHGWFPWEEAPIKFPRILHYIAVGNTTQERLITSGLKQENISFLSNFVDLDKFKRRNDFFNTPQRALVMSNTIKNRDFLIIKEACHKCNINIIDGVGKAFKNIHSNPANLFNNYDLVFAQGKTAYEALATGAAVISADGRGAMIKSHNMVSQQLFNFASISLRGDNFNAESVVEKIQQYDARDVETVCDFIRSNCGKNKTTEKLVNLYYQTIIEFENLPKPDKELEYKAISQYLCQIKKNIAASFRPTSLPSRLRRFIHAIQSVTGEKYFFKQL